jgi:hypothetical protein
VSGHLATFRTRGVAVPVTTPQLMGTRVRESDRCGIEFIVPNASDAGSIYVVQAGGIRAICQPTVHDALLIHRLSRLDAVTPPTVRHTAVQIAREGYAGRAAAEAAEARIATDHAQQRRMYQRLLARLIEAVAPGTLPGNPDAAILEQHADAALGRIAPLLGCPPTRLAAGLHALATAFAPTGFARHDEGARIPQLVWRIRDTCAALTDWIEQDANHDVGGLGQTVAVPMRLAWEAGDMAAGHVHAILRNPLDLLRHWIADASDILAFAARADWLLDGWDQACLLWLLAETDSARRIALLELPRLVPVLPQEAANWLDLPIPAEATEQACWVVSREEGWRSGAAAHAMIERNENMRARSL